VILAMQQVGPKAPGRLSKLLLGLLVKRAIVVATEQSSGHFRLLTLEGPALRDVAWTPGQKVQIAMGSAFVARTYTPIDWNAVAGRTRILGYAHGDGPGSVWVRGLKPGDECDVFGPRRSLAVNGATGPLAMLGDETSIALAHALLHQDRARAIVCHFEVDDVEAGRRVTARLGLGDAVLFGRREFDAHLEMMDAAISPLAASGATFVLTGKASTIQRLRQTLKRQAVPTRRIVTKAYWAPGRAGLD
jgi:NADPH-dependent ferric siderophore reductase